MNGIPTDFTKFFKAVKDSRDKQELYVAQVNSIDDLNKRAKATKESLTKASDKIKQIKDHMG